MDLGGASGNNERDGESVASSQPYHTARGANGKTNSYACSVRDDISEVYSTMGDDVVFKVFNVHMHLQNKSSINLISIHILQLFSQ